MKKHIAVCLASILLFVGLTACNRRDQYRDPVGTDTNTEKTSPTTNAVGPGNVIDPSPMGVGSPYANMNTNDLEQLYYNSSFTMMSSDFVYNTPYYYIFSRGNSNDGGVAYSKLTGNMVTLCKELACSHNDCIFSGRIDECIVLDESIYYIISYGDFSRIYTSNYLMDDIAFLWEGEDIDDAAQCEGKLYLIVKIWDEVEDVTKRKVYVLNLENRTLEPAFTKEFPFQSGRIINGYLYYTLPDGSLWQLDISTEHKICLMDNSLLNLENGDIRFVPYRIVGKNVLEFLRQNVMYDEICYYDLTMKTETSSGLNGDMSIFFWNDVGQYICMDHTIQDFKNDQHYVYYQDKYSGGFVNKSGGEIWFRDLDNDNRVLIARLMTDSIPDAIYGIVAADGKTIMVKYQTYEDFPNVYNSYNKTTPGSMIQRYAVIDLETGKVYKNDFLIN